MPRNTIYYSQWDEDGIDWRLEFIPASDSDLDAPDYVEIPEDAFNLLGDIAGKFPDKLPIGLVENDAIEIEFNMRFLPADMRNYLINPKAPYNRTYSIGNNRYDPGRLRLINVPTTNVFIVKSGTNGTLTTRFIGIQRKVPSRKMTFTEDGVDFRIELSHIAKEVLTKVSTSDLIWELESTRYSPSVVGCCYDLFVADPTKTIKKAWLCDGVLNDAVNLELLADYYSVEDLQNAINRLANRLFCFYMRVPYDTTGLGWFGTYGNLLIAWTFYKQTDAPNHARGAALTTSQIHFPGRYYKSTDPYTALGGWFYTEKDKASISEHENVWNLYKSWGENFGCKIAFHYSGVNVITQFQRIRDSIFTLPAPIALADNAAEGGFIIEDGYLQLKNSTANLRLGGDNIEEIVLNSPGSVSEEDYECKVGFNNLPTLTDIDKSKTVSQTFSGLETQIFKQNGFEPEKLCYIDTQSDVVVSGTQAIRVHDICDFSDGVTTYLSNYSLNLVIDIGYQYYIHTPILRLQQNAGTAYTFVAAILKMFTHEEQAFTEIVIPLSKDFVSTLPQLHAGMVVTISKATTEYGYDSADYLGHIGTTAVIMGYTLSPSGSQLALSLFILGVA